MQRSPCLHACYKEKEGAPLSGILFSCKVGDSIFVGEQEGEVEVWGELRKFEI